MITDKETNKLYLSLHLKTWYPKFFKNFKNALDQCGIQPEYLKETKDVWCVDYMPVQINKNEFAQFKFDPKYLKPKKYHKYVSDPLKVCEHLKLRISDTDIIADGGNITRSKNKVIMTTRVIEENPQYSIHDLIDKISKFLQIDQLILIPQQPDDFTGHSDGMIRFIDEETVLLNDFSDEPNREFVDSLYTALDRTGLKIIEIPTSIFANRNVKDATGDYINYLQMDGFIFLPIFNRKEDEKVINQFEELFPNSKILPVESNDLSKDGGVINCISWNIVD